MSTTNNAGKKEEFNHLNRIIFLSGNINEQKTENFISTILQYECENPLKDILVFIDSYGGSIDSFIAMHDIIKMIRADVATICIGKAMSAAQLLLISGTKGKRFITPYSRVLIHELSMNSSGKISDLTSLVEEGKRMQDNIINKLIIKYSKITKVELDKIISNETYLDAEECIKYGIVDHIISDPNVLYKKVKT